MVEEIDKDLDLVYTDQWGRRNYEYVSLGCDNLPVLKGRTPVQCYADFMRAFKEKFQNLLGETIVVMAPLHCLAFTHSFLPIARCLCSLCSDCLLGSLMSSFSGNPSRDGSSW